MRRLTVVALCPAAGLSLACRKHAPAAEVEAALRSTDTVAVYNAGVDAYRARDFALARVLWRHAADLGAHEAETNLGFLMYYGYGGPADTAQAIAYWQSAMAHLDAAAHHQMAQAILAGNDRLGSDLEAYSHLAAARILAQRPNQLAADLIVRDADQLRQRLLAYLPRSKVELAESVGRRWSEAYEPQGRPPGSAR